MVTESSPADSLDSTGLWGRATGGSRLGMVRRYPRGMELPGVSGHLLHHGEHQLAVAVIQADGVAADLAEEADFVVGELRQAFATVGVSGFGEELRERQLHGSGDFRKRVERRDSVAVFHARKIATQQAGALLDIALGHSFLQPVVPDG